MYVRIESYMYVCMYVCMYVNVCKYFFIYEMYVGVMSFLDNVIDHKCTYLYVCNIWNVCMYCMYVCMYVWNVGLPQRLLTSRRLLVCSTETSSLLRPSRSIPRSPSCRSTPPTPTRCCPPPRCMYVCMSICISKCVSI